MSRPFLLLCALLSLTAPAHAARAGRDAAARPDRALYQTAREARVRLEGSRRLGARRAEWEKVVVQFRAVVARYPRSGYCDDALLAIGDAYREMARRFRAPRYLDDAVRSYTTLVDEYPRSSLGERALFAAFEIEGEGPGLKAAAERYLENYPDGAHARAVRGALRERPRATGAAQPAPSAPVAKASENADAEPTPRPSSLARLFELKSWSGASATRIVIELERRVTYQQGRLDNPDRLFIDLLGTRIHPNLKSRTFPVGDGLLQQVRVAQYNDEVVRIVLDFKDISTDTIFYVDDPVRLIVDVRAPQTAPAEPRTSPAARPLADASAAGAPSPTPTPLPPAPPLANPTPVPARAATPPPVPARPDDGAARPTPRRTDDPSRPSPPPSRPSEATEPLGTTDAARASALPVEPARRPTPQPNRSGSFSISRQLGLGARRIVIDPGHGGHDPGTIGRSGLQEKDLVLDVALRLEKLVRAELGLEVVMTRRSDVSIPLVERTAIANAKEADLFLSIHVNSSRNSRASGIETYYLSFAIDAHAQEVAARENAISAATLKDLSDLVKAITRNSKIEESRDFAANVQQAMVSQLRASNDAADDRGVRRAPFLVLLGANMPSILAEIAFVSHRHEERLLRSTEYRDQIATALLEGVRRYLDALEAGKLRALTSAPPRTKLGAREARR